MNVTARIAGAVVGIHTAVLYGPPIAIPQATATSEMAPPETATSETVPVKIAPPETATWEGAPATSVRSKTRTVEDPADAIRYAINVDPGAEISRARVTTIIADILADRRGWESVKHVRFIAVRWSDAKLRIWIMQPIEIDRRCAPLTTDGYTSCAIGWNVYINADRWKYGAEAAAMNHANYRRYVVNHEIGHALGERHRPCPGHGRLAPVMLQQTLGLRGCRPNPWPNPNATRRTQLRSGAEIGARSGGPT